MWEPTRVGDTAPKDDMKKFLITAVLALLTVGGTIAVTDAPASAAPGSPGCVTRSEFRQVHRGMTQAQVQRVFGTRGELLDGAAAGLRRDTDAVAAEV